MSIRHILPKGDLSAEHKRLVRGEIDNLDPAKTWIVQAKEYKRKRTLEQNAFLHAVPLRLIADFTGHDIADLKEYLLGECFGWEEYMVLDMKKKRPMKRSSDLTTETFNHFLEYIESWAAEALSMIIPKPNEVID